MHAEYFLINKSSDRKAIETVSESFPELDVVSALTFIIETVDSVN
jgi:hypothetical protein